MIAYCPRTHARFVQLAGTAMQPSANASTPNSGNIEHHISGRNLPRPRMPSALGVRIERVRRRSRRPRQASGVVRLCHTRAMRCGHWRSVAGTHDVSSRFMTWVSAGCSKTRNVLLSSRSRVRIRRRTRVLPSAQHNRRYQIASAHGEPDRRYDQQPGGVRCPQQAGQAQNDPEDAQRKPLACCPRCDPPRSACRHVTPTSHSERA